MLFPNHPFNVACTDKLTRKHNAQAAVDATKNIARQHARTRKSLDKWVDFSPISVA